MNTDGRMTGDTAVRSFRLIGPIRRIRRIGPTHGRIEVQMTIEGNL
jgi:hypothetical protein